MTYERIRLCSLVVAITLVSGIGDSQGFVHAARVWQDGRLVWDELAKSALGFAVGIGAFWLSVKYLRELGVLAPETQSILWFGITMIGVAAASGRFFVWRALEQTVAIAVLVGIGWLVSREAAGQ